MQSPYIGPGLCHHTRPFATIVEDTMYVKAFSIRLHHAAQRRWHEVCWEFGGSEPRGRGNYWRSTKEHGKQCRDQGVWLIQSSSRSGIWQPRVGGIWGCGLVTGLEHTRRQLVPQIQNQIILGILWERDWSCTDHLAYHALIMRLIMCWSYLVSHTDHVPLEAMNIELSRQESVSRL